MRRYHFVRYLTLVQIFYGHVLSIRDIVRLIYLTAIHKHHINIIYMVLYSV